MNPRYAILLFLALMALVSCGRAEQETPRAVSRDFESAEKAYWDGNYSSAFPLYMRFVEEMSDSSHTDQYINALFHLGDIHYYYNDYSSAIDCFKQGLSVAAELGDTRWQEKFLSNICGAYQMLGQYDNAMTYCEMIDSVTGLSTNSARYSYDYQKGYLHLFRGDPELARPLLSEALRIAESAGLDTTSLCNASCAFGDYYGICGRWDSAAYYIHKAYEYASATNNRWAQTLCLRKLMQVYANMDNIDKFRYYQGMYQDFADSAMNNREYLYIRTINDQYEKEKHFRQISEIQQRVDRQRMITLLIASVGLLTLCFLAVIYRKKRQLDSSYRALFERNRELVELERASSALSAEPSGPVNAAECAVSADKGSCADKDLLDRILAVMEDTAVFCDPQFGLVQLTMAVNSNVAYVSKVINDSFGMNVPAFINEYRIREARRRITDDGMYGNYTIQAIAESVGYETQSTFNRTFKKITGMTPSMYLKLARKEHE